MQVLNLLVDTNVGRVAADGFYIIMADYEEVMSVKMHVNYRVGIRLTHNLSCDFSFSLHHFKVTLGVVLLRTHEKNVRFYLY